MDSFLLARLKTIRFLFTHKNGDLGTISVTEQSWAAPISKQIESHISDRCSYYTGYSFSCRYDSEKLSNIAV